MTTDLLMNQHGRKVDRVLRGTTEVSGVSKAASLLACLDSCSWHKEIAVVRLDQLLPVLGVLIQLEAVLEGCDLVLLRALWCKALAAAFGCEHRICVQAPNVGRRGGLCFELHDSAVLLCNLSVSEKLTRHLNEDHTISSLTTQIWHSSPL